MLPMKEQFPMLMDELQCRKSILAFEISLRNEDCILNGIEDERQISSGSWSR